MKDKLKIAAANEQNPKWQNIISREKELYKRTSDIRSDFERDYNRIINSLAFRRIKHKTQVFFSPTNDHICTRLEHVILVESISNTIASYLGLNTALTKAIAMAHDIGHSPFGHEGERILSEISKRDVGETFWHERNGMEIVDKIVLLEDDKQNSQNLNLTYAVRDGIISHCGEIDQNSLFPREETINLYDYNYPNEYSPYTWEGCVVKVADKIAYLGRDIQDAITLGIIEESLDELREILNLKEGDPINNTVIINYLISDLCENTSLEAGLKFSDEAFAFMNKLKAYNYKHIYLDERVKACTSYFRLIIESIYGILKRYYTEKDHIAKLYPSIIAEFEDWLSRYWNKERSHTSLNQVVVDLNDEKSFNKAIIYYISGMTDNYAIDTYNKIIGF